MNISFVIPCLNSEVIIKSSVKKLTKKLKKIKNLKYELILIDDGISDKTNKIINGLKDCFARSPATVSAAVFANWLLAPSMNVSKR